MANDPAEESEQASGEDNQAQFELAVRLMSGRPAREDVLRAVSLLESASSLGHAQASEKCALLSAMGVTRPPDWEHSLDYLQLAAEQGSRGAQGQLLLLGDNSQDPQFPESSEAGLWKRIRTAIPIAERLQADASRTLSETPRIRVIERFATPAECRWIVSAARPRLQPATVFDKSSGAQIHHRARDNSYFVLQIENMDVVTEVLRNRIAAATKLPVPIFEPTQILCYAVGQSFKPHHDFLDPKNPAYREELARSGQRIATFLLYLNDDYSSGETSFPAIGLSYRGKMGDALFFANVDRDGRADPNTLHAGLPPTSGEKWVLSQWIRDRTPA